MDNYIRRVRNVEVVDGDTFRADIDLGFDVWLNRQTFRLYGVNAFETTRRGNWDNGLKESEITAKLKLGKRAKDILINLVDNSAAVYVQSRVKPKRLKGKYGRWLCVMWLVDMNGETNFNDWLIENGMGYKYLI